MKGGRLPWLVRPVLSPAGRPLAVVNVAGINSFLQAVFEAILWCAGSFVLASGKFPIYTV